MATSNPQNKPDEPASPKDADLVARAQKGDLAAFDELVTRHRQKAYAMIYQMVRNEQDAWDLAQDGFVRAWKSLPRFHGGAAFYTWLYRIMANLAIDHIRRRAKRAELEFDEAIDPRDSAEAGGIPGRLPGPRAELEHAELRERIQAALEKLSPDHRAVITLKEIEGLQYNEIAEVVGCSIGTVMSRLFHARRKLQRSLADLYEKV